MEMRGNRWQEEGREMKKVDTDRNTGEKAEEERRKMKGSRREREGEMKRKEANKEGKEGG